MSKIFWFDTETSGVFPWKHALLQLGGLVEVDGEIKDFINIQMRPSDDDIIEPSALKKNSLKEVDIMEYPPLSEGMTDLKHFLGSYVNKFNTGDKFVLAGYNVEFDESFLRKAFSKDNDRFFGSWFFWPKIDVQTYVAERVADGLRLPNFKLETLCKHFDIQIDAHEAVSDITATRKLYLLLKNYNERNPTKDYG